MPKTKKPLSLRGRKQTKSAVKARKIWASRNLRAAAGKLTQNAPNKK